MQPIPSDVDEMSRRRSRRELPSSRKPLIRGAGEYGKEKERAQHDENALLPAPHVTSPVKSCAQPTHSVMSGFPICPGRTKASTCACARVYESLQPAGSIPVC